MGNMDANDLRLAVGERVRNYRMSNHCTQAYFAEMIDISVNFLSEIENGKKGMSQETLYKLCEHFDLSADYILFGKTVPQSEPESTKRISEVAQTLNDAELNTLIDFLVSLRKLRSFSI